MATITSAQSGAWSSASTWVGGALPVDGDAVTIAAEHSVLMDVDLSAFIGLQTITVQGHASTPAMLYFASGTSGHLKLRTGYNIVGTTGALKGRILANSDGVWENTGSLPFADKAVVDLQGSASITATYLEIRTFCAGPILKMVRTYGAKKTISSVDVATDTLTSPAHGMANGTPVWANSTEEIPAPLQAQTVYYVVNSATDTLKLALTSGGPAINLTSAGSGTIELLTGAASGVSTLNVLDDVSGDTAWTMVSGHNRAVLVNATKPAVLDQQRITITGITATTITLSAATDSVQYPGAVIVLASRNISIRSTATSTSTAIISDSVNGIFGCEITNTAGSGSLFYSYALSTSYYNTINGTIIGVYYAVYNGSNSNTINGIVSGCDTALSSSNYNTVNGKIIGCKYAVYVSNGNTINGQISGCDYALYIRSNYNTINGQISGCDYAISASYYNTINGEIIGCRYAIAANSSYNTINGTISGCTYVLSQSTGNKITGEIFGVGTTYTPTTQAARERNQLRNALITSIVWSGRNASGASARLTFENFGRVDGAHRISDMFGDIIKMQCGSGAPIPPLDPNGGTDHVLECSSIQSNCSPINPLVILDDLRLWMMAGTHTVRFKTINTFSGGLAAGNVVLTAEYLTTGNIQQMVREDATVMSVASDWSQGIQVTFTSTVDGWVSLNLWLQKYASGLPLLYVYPIPVVS